MKNLWEKVKAFFSDADKKKVAAHAAVTVGLTVLTYNSLQPQDVTTWAGVLELIKGVGTNPFLLGLCVFDVFSAISDTKKKVV